ncbi:MAG TPA: response regulator [Kofleriaceae bacterium]|nr:response regulator [Kofleriaceae bacterium]
MPRILTVDDSSTLRGEVADQMTELGYQVDQAENGAQGLARLALGGIDLVLLDVHMPVMDGPTMLAAMRERGDRTPVVMLTSESRRQVIASALKLGIDDYILKPHRPDELRAKIQKALRIAPAAQPVESSGSAGDPIDILLIDDVLNVHRRLRALLPGKVTMNACAGARDAIELCQRHGYRLIVIDLAIPGVDSVALAGQLAALQPHASLVALVLRTVADQVSEREARSFRDQLLKPFDPAAVEQLLATHLGSA